jgi:hypothetical protein
MYALSTLSGKASPGLYMALHFGFSLSTGMFTLSPGTKGGNPLVEGNLETL